MIGAGRSLFHTYPAATFCSLYQNCTVASLCTFFVRSIVSLTR